MTMRVTLRSAAAALALTIAATGAQANDFFPGSGFPSGSPFSLTSHGNIGARNTNIEGDRVTNPLGSLPASGGPITVNAGGFSVSEDGDKFIAWCLDTLRALTLSSSEYFINNSNPFTNDTGPDLTGKKSTITDLFNRGYDRFLSEISNTNSAGFQLALWEIVNESGPTLDAGDGGFFANTAAVVTEANRYLSYLSGGSDEQAIGNGGKGYNVFYLETTGTGQNAGQNLVTVSPVPLPAAGVLLLAGLGGMAAARKLRRRADA